MTVAQNVRKPGIKLTTTNVLALLQKKFMTSSYTSSRSAAARVLRSASLSRKHPNHVHTYFLADKDQEVHPREDAQERGRESDLLPLALIDT